LRVWEKKLLLEGAGAVQEHGTGARTAKTSKQSKPYYTKKQLQVQKQSKTS
jgi:hypothetical protein